MDECSWRLSLKSSNIVAFEESGHAEQTHEPTGRDF
jgi:hypothetical protein